MNRSSVPLRICATIAFVVLSTATAPAQFPTRSKGDFERLGPYHFFPTPNGLARPATRPPSSACPTGEPGWHLLSAPVRGLARCIRFRAEGLSGVENRIVAVWLGNGDPGGTAGVPDDEVEAARRRLAARTTDIAWRYGIPVVYLGNSRPTPVLATPAPSRGAPSRVAAPPPPTPPTAVDRASATLDAVVNRWTVGSLALAGRAAHAATILELMADRSDIACAVLVVPSARTPNPSPSGAADHPPAKAADRIARPQPEGRRRLLLLAVTEDDATAAARAKTWIERGEALGYRSGLIRLDRAVVPRPDPVSAAGIAVTMCAAGRSTEEIAETLRRPAEPTGNDR